MQQQKDTYKTGNNEPNGIIFWQLINKINQEGGGVAFADGGEINEKNCKCMGKRYKFGGELISDFDIVKQLTSVGKFVTKPINSARIYVDGLISRMSK